MLASGTIALRDGAVTLILSDPLVLDSGSAVGVVVRVDLAETDAASGAWGLPTPSPWLPPLALFAGLWVWVAQWRSRPRGRLMLVMVVALALGCGDGDTTPTPAPANNASPGARTAVLTLTDIEAIDVVSDEAIAVEGLPIESATLKMD